MQELNQMLTIAGGVIIAGAIGLVFSLGWELATASDRYASRWAQRLLGIAIVLSMLAASFWIVFIRTGIISWYDLVQLLPAR
jgi:hypothetical protein